MSSEPVISLVDDPNGDVERAVARREWLAALAAGGHSEFSEFDFGWHHYRFQRSIRSHVLKNGSTFLFWLNEFGNELKGTGANVEVARSDWESKLHCRYQMLSQLHQQDGIRRSSSDEREWHRLRRIRFEDRREQFPASDKIMVFTAELKSVGPLLLRFVDGTEREIDLRYAPVELATCRAGQWMKATCESFPDARGGVAIRAVEFIDPVHIMSEEEARVYLDGLPKTSGLPTASWDDI